MLSASFSLSATWVCSARRAEAGAPHKTTGQREKSMVITSTEANVPKDSIGKTANPHSQSLSKIDDRCNKTRTQGTLTMDTVNHKLTSNHHTKPPSKASLGWLFSKLKMQIFFFFLAKHTVLKSINSIPSL